MTVDEALKNLQLTISEFRGTVQGQVLTGSEHLVVQTSFTQIVNELKRLQEIEKNVAADKDVRKG